MNDPSAHLSLTVSEEPDAVVLTSTGELDYFTSTLFADRVAELIDLHRPCTVLDLSEVGFCDSVGLSALVQAKRRADRTGTALVLRGVQPAVRRALSITGLDSILPLRDTGEDGDADDADLG